MPPRRTSRNSLIRIRRRSGWRWIKPGSSSAETSASWNRSASPVEHRGDHLRVDVVADLAAAHAELDELQRAVRILAPHEPVDRAAQAHAGVVAADHRDAVRHRVGRRRTSSVRSSHQSSVAQNPCVHHLGGRVEPGREASRPRAGTPPGTALPSTRSPRTPCPWRRRPARRCPRRVRRGSRARRSGASRPRRSALGAPRRRVARLLDPRSCRTVAETAARRDRERKNPRDLPARREPKLPATVGLSGSGAPSNLRAVASVDRTAQRRLARGAPATLPSGGLALRRSLPDGGLPVRIPLAGFPVGAVASALRLPRPGSASGLATFRGPRAPSPCGVPGASSGLLASCTSTAWSEAKITGDPRVGSTSRFRRSEHISAGHRPAGKSDNSTGDVTTITPR